MTAIYLLLPVALLLVSTCFSIFSVRRGRSPKKAVAIHLLAFLVIMALTIALPLTVSAVSADTVPAPETISVNDETAAEEEAPAASPNASSMGLGMLAAALVTGMSGIGGGIAVAAAAPAAIGATSEDPKNFGKSLIFVALGEGIALYGLLMSILIWAKY